MAVRKASVMTVKGLLVLERVKTGPWIKVACKVLNMVLHSGVQSHFAPFLGRLWRGQAIVEKSGMNFW